MNPCHPAATMSVPHAHTAATLPAQDWEEPTRTHSFLRCYYGSCCGRGDIFVSSADTGGAVRKKGDSDREGEQQRTMEGGYHSSRLSVCIKLSQCESVKYTESLRDILNILLFLKGKEHTSYPIESESDQSSVYDILKVCVCVYYIYVCVCV